jgi:hypothetical protein
VYRYTKSTEAFGPVSSFRYAMRDGAATTPTDEVYQAAFR